MTADRRKTSASDYGISVFFLVAAFALGLVAVSVRAAGFLGVMDQITTMSDAFEAGRLQGAQAAVLLGVATGIGWAGLCGLTSSSDQRLMCARGCVVASIGACASLILGIWLTALVLAVAAIALFVLGRRVADSTPVEV